MDFAVRAERRCDTAAAADLPPHAVAAFRCLGIAIEQVGVEVGQNLGAEKFAERRVMNIAEPKAFDRAERARKHLAVRGDAHAAPERVERARGAVLGELAQGMPGFSLTG